MDEARARRLQPHYVRAFFLAAFKLLGGSIAEREAGRYRDPARARRRARPGPADRHRRAGAAPVRASDVRPGADRPAGATARGAARPRPPAAGRGHRPGHRALRQPAQARHNAGRTGTTPASSRGCWPRSRRRSPMVTTRPVPSPSGSTSSRSIPTARGRRQRPAISTTNHPGFGTGSGGHLLAEPWLRAGVESARRGLGGRAWHARPAGEDSGAGVGAGESDPQAGHTAAHPGDQLLGRPARRTARSRGRRAAAEDQARHRIPPRTRSRRTAGAPARRPRP